MGMTKVWENGSGQVFPLEREEKEPKCHCSEKGTKGRESLKLSSAAVMKAQATLEGICLGSSLPWGCFGVSFLFLQPSFILNHACVFMRILNTFLAAYNAAVDTGALDKH